jgi:hypothetical protein
MRRSNERGQALPLLLVVLVLAAAVAVLVADLGAAAVHRARARTAADAAALAGAADGEAAARDVAQRNGAELVGFAVDGPIVEVVVRHGPASATATAEGIVGAGRADGLAPALAAALARAEQLLGRAVTVTAVDDRGLGFDVDPAVAEALAGVAERAGLCRQAPTARPVHFAPCPPISPG